MEGLERVTENLQKENRKEKGEIIILDAQRFMIMKTDSRKKKTKGTRKIEERRSLERLSPSLTSLPLSFQLLSFPRKPAQSFLSSPHSLLDFPMHFLSPHCATGKPHLSAAAAAADVACN